MTVSEIISIYDEFLKSFTPLLKVEDEQSYQEALSAIDQLFEVASDTELDPYSLLITLLANAIEKYELLDPELNEFIGLSNAPSTDKENTGPNKSI